MSESEKITANDLKWLHSGTSRLWIVELFSVIFLLAMSLLHLYLASVWAKMAGLSLFQAWQRWGSGINPGQQYSGVYLKAMEQFDSCGILLILAVFSGVMGLLQRHERRRKTRLLAMLIQ